MIHDGDTFDLSVAGTQGQLRLRADVGKGTRLAREGGEPIAPENLILVNGKEYGRALIQEALNYH